MRGTPWLGHLSLEVSSPPLTLASYQGPRHNPLLDVELDHPAVAVCGECGADLVERLDDHHDDRVCPVHGRRRSWRVRYGDGGVLEAPRVPLAEAPSVAVALLREGASVTSVAMRTHRSVRVVQKWAARIAEGAL